jgi:lysophospholipase L1-like esterase
MYWYEDEVKRLENDRGKLGYAPETIFYGSSSIRMWETLYTDFEALKPVNLGFGGSTLAACVWFFERIMAPYQPRRLVIYAGDNDLGDGRHPEELFIFFQELAVKVNARFGNLPCYYISLKPSISRWNLVNLYRYSNELISNEIVRYGNNWHYLNIFDRMLDVNGRPKNEFYAGDGLHLSQKGYAVWKEVVGNAITGNS